VKLDARTGRFRPSEGGSAVEAQAGGLRKTDETASRRAWGGIRRRGLFHIKPQGQRRGFVRLDRDASTSSSH
jgi:hypothetical protein